MAFGAKDDSALGIEVSLIVGFFSTFVEAVDPVAGGLEFRKGLGDIRDANDRHMFEGTGGGFRNGFGDANGTAFRDDQRTCANCRGSAEDGTEIVRIFDAIEDDNQFVIKDVVEILVFLFGPEGENALMTGGAAGVAVERFSRFKAEGHLALAAEINDLLNSWAAGTLCNQHSVKGTSHGERLLHGMNPYQYRHLY